eukprot:jgi/Bigna1/135299/aug1.28_g10007
MTAIRGLSRRGSLMLVLLLAMGQHHPQQTQVSSLLNDPRIVKSSWRRVTVDVAGRQGGPERFQVGVIDLYFDRPMFYNGSLSLMDLNAFMLRHRFHRQIMYGAFELRCPHHTFPSHPIDKTQCPVGSSGSHLSYAAFLMPLPVPRTTEFVWLRPLEALYPNGYMNWNRISLALLHSHQHLTEQGSAAPTAFVLNDDCDKSCSFHFLNLEEQRWHSKRPWSLTSASGRPPSKQQIRLDLDCSNDPKFLVVDEMKLKRHAMQPEVTSPSSSMQQEVTPPSSSSSSTSSPPSLLQTTSLIKAKSGVGIVATSLAYVMDEITHLVPSDLIITMDDAVTKKSVELAAGKFPKSRTKAKFPVQPKEPKFRELMSRAVTKDMTNISSSASSWASGDSSVLGGKDDKELGDNEEEEEDNFDESMYEIRYIEDFDLQKTLARHFRQARTSSHNPRIVAKPKLYRFRSMSNGSKILANRDAKSSRTSSEKRGLPSVMSLQLKVDMSSKFGMLTNALAKDAVAVVMQGLVEDVVQWFTQEMSRRMHDYLAPRLINYCREETVDILAFTLIKGLNKTLMEVPQKIAKKVQEPIVKKLKVTMSQTLIRSLTHGLGNSISQSLSYTNLHCALCSSKGLSDHCARCPEPSMKVHMAQKGNMYNLDYYASYFSDYYSQLILSENEVYKDVGKTFKPPT